MFRLSCAPLIRCVILAYLLPHFLFAADGTWIGGSGNWGDPNNWLNGIVADGAAQLAIFSNDANIVVTVDSPRTIGHIYKGAPGQLSIQAPGPLTLSDPLKPTITNDEGTVVINVPLAGDRAFAKYGFGGEVVMSSGVVHSMTGNLRINEGVVRFDSAGRTIPSVNQVYVVDSGAGARLHRTGPNDPMSVYPCTFRLNGYGPLPPDNTPPGALFIDADGLVAAVSNILIDFGAISRIGQVGPGTSRLELRGTISGNSQPQFFARDGIKIFDFIGTNIYTSLATHFTVESGTGIFNILSSHCLPSTAAFPPHAHQDALLIIDMHTNQQYVAPQTVTASDITGAGTVVFRSTGGTGWLFLDANNFGMMIHSGGGTFRMESGTIHIPKYGGVCSSGTFEMTGGELYCGLEFMAGFPFPNGLGTINLYGGILRPFVTRIGSQSPGVLNLFTGAVLRTSGIWSFDNAADSYLYFNGGTLSDGDWPDWEGSSYTNWIRNPQNILIQSGGAFIEVWGERTIAHPLKHDPALGSAPDGGLTKIGPGILHLAAANTWNGPTIVSNGILTLDIPDALPSASKLLRIDAGAACSVERLPNAELSVAEGRTVAGDGTLIGSLVLNANGSISPGASVGTFAVTSNVTLNSGASYLWDIGAAGAADLISVEGALSILAPQNTFTVRVAIASTPDESNTYVLATALNGINGSTDGIFMDYGTTGLVGPDHPTIDGNNLVVTLIIPEPAALLICAAALLTLRRALSYVL